jgi:acetyl-CoA carboxylase carboxyl transferase subunit alpha
MENEIKEPENRSQEPCTLDFEKEINEVEAKIYTLKHNVGLTSAFDIALEIERLEKKLKTLLTTVYGSLDAWQITQVARHPERPHFCDYINGIFTDFVPLAGDRCFGEDKAIIGGPAKFKEQTVMIIGQEKGKGLEGRLTHNFGMARPEGYRKAMRLMDLAQRFSMPVLTFVDTAGAFPGIDAEERGQGQAISDCIEKCLSLNVPLIATVIGEGGSGGAVALAAANKVLMLEYSIYSVISPEGCAAILWKDREKAPLAAKSLKMTAADLSALGIIDEIIKEPLGAAHRNYSEVMRSVSDALERNLEQMQGLSGEYIKNMRRDKFMKMTIIH